MRAGIPAVWALLLGAAVSAIVLLLWMCPVKADEWPGRGVHSALQITPLPPVQRTDGRAGACYAFYYDSPPSRPYIPLARDAGSRWDRFDFAWPRLEPANNQWDQGVMQAYDDLIRALRQGGIENIVGILLWTPDWAATGGTRGLALPDSAWRPRGWYAPTPYRLPAPAIVHTASSPPQGLYLPWNDPNNHWGDFVYTVVSRYRDRVKHWEMWNEPEWLYFWSGTSTDYAQLLKVGYQATKAACPDCTVLFGGLHYWAKPDYYRWVLNLINQDPLAPQHNYFFDVMSVHFYSNPTDIWDKVREIRSGMEVYRVGDHPIWLTETGVPVWNDSRVDPDPSPYDYAATQEEAASYVIQSYANALAAGVERYLFFRVHDADMGEYFGLVRNDRTLRPSYIAYQVATTYLISPTWVTREQRGEHVNVTLWGTPRGKISVLWNKSPVTGTYVLTATLPQAVRVDKRGLTRTVAAVATPAGMVYTVTLPAATARLVSQPSRYFIGGDPLLLVESEAVNAPPTATVRSLPEFTYTPVFTVSWEGRDNQSGVWYYDVQVRDGPLGVWQDWLTRTTATVAAFTGEHGHTYYFRVRATDRLGHQAGWRPAPQASTKVVLLSTLHVSIGAFFADDNRNGVWERPIVSGTATLTITPELTLTGVSLRFLNYQGHDVVSPTVGSAWAFTTLIHPGTVYRLQAVTVDYGRTLWLSWTHPGEVYTLTYPALGLWPLTRLYLPLILRRF